MVNKPKIAGTAAETAVVRYLQEHGFPHAERRALSGILDKGDVAGVPAHCLEVKNCARLDLGGWMAEVAAEKFNSNAEIGVAIIKRRGKGDPGQWYVVQTLDQWVAERRRFGYGSPVPEPAEPTPFEQQELDGVA